jgi:hypothetical protein
VKGVELLAATVGSIGLSATDVSVIRATVISAELILVVAPSVAFTKMPRVPAVVAAVKPTTVPEVTLSEPMAPLVIDQE